MLFYNKHSKLINVSGGPRAAPSRLGDSGRPRSGLYPTFLTQCKRKSIWLHSIVYELRTSKSEKEHL